MEEIEQPENLKINLYKHQKVSVYKMEKLEKYKRITINQYNCETEFGILGDIPGYGKSYSIISLILRDKMEWDINEEHIKTDIKILNDYVRLSSTIFKKRIKTNLILCSVSIMNQWKEYFKNAPSLSVYEITTNKHIKDHVIGKYDVVIVSSNRYNELMENVGDNIVWKRFIYDEAASLYISKMKNINFGFMWLITSTYEYLCFGNKGIHFLHNFMRNIYTDYIKYFVIKNKEKFIKESFELPPVKFITHQCLNPKILLILNNHIDEETRIMISAGNIKGAIIKNGGNIYSTSNLIDIVKKKKEEKIITYKQSFEFWDKRGNKKESDQWKDRIKNCEIELKDIEEKYKQLLKEDCSICYQNIINHTMVSCCQNIFCGNCIMKWLQLNNNTCPLCRHNIKTSDLSFISDKNEKNEKSKKQIVIDIINDCVNKNRKVILFSSYDESFEEIRKDLDDNKIDFVEIYGQRSVREAKIENFINGSVNVIFLNTLFNGAGINLEIADDIILYHKMCEGVKKQVLGRALRIGRKNELLVHEFEETKF
jgi:hypothetical protein